MAKLPAFLALAAFLLPCLAAADDPGTRTPKSPGWGIDYRERLDEVFADVRSASGYGTNTNLAFFPQPKKDAQGRFVKNMDGSLQVGDIPAQFKGVGAAAFAPNIGMNKGNNNAVLMATSELFEICHDPDELAFVLAHEMAHLVLNHPKLVADDRERIFNAWYDEKERKDPNFVAMPTPAKIALLESEKGKEFAAFQYPLEEAADTKGREIVGLVNKALGRQKYQQKGSSMMLHAKDFFWVMGLKEGDDHPPIMTRAKNFKEIDLQQTLPADWNK